MGTEIMTGLEPAQPRAGAALADKLLRHMHRRPGRGYVANNLIKLFKVSADEITAALDELVHQGELVTAVLPPRSLAYFVRPQGVASPERTVWRELRGWEAGLHNRQALFELIRGR